MKDAAQWLGLAAVLTLTTASGCSDDDDVSSGGAGANGSGANGSGANGSGASSTGGGANPAVPTVTKFDILGAGTDSGLHDELCAADGQPAGCDVCEGLGFYGDFECDTSLIDSGLCAGPDPDCAAQTADYYVAPNGSDGGDGSENQPFATLQHAHDVAQPGDLIYLRGGTYQPTDRTLFTGEGTAAEPIIVRSYPGELPIFDASNLPEGNTEGASTATWHFNGAKHWQLRGPLQLVDGRGAGVLIEEDTQDVDFVHIESSYNGRTASRGGHGFNIVEEQWADAKNIRFINCDAHHNANHRTKSGEDVAENLYQHGDGWRIKSGENIQLVGCRAWHNLDDNYDLVWAAQPISLYQTWSAFAGRDDMAGSMTGTPGFEAEWGEGIKLGYDDDTGPHSFSASAWMVGRTSWRTARRSRTGVARWAGSSVLPRTSFKTASTWAR